MSDDQADELALLACCIMLAILLTVTLSAVAISVGWL